MFRVVLIQAGSEKKWILLLPFFKYLQNLIAFRCSYFVLAASSSSVMHLKIKGVWLADWRPLRCEQVFSLTASYYAKASFITALHHDKKIIPQLPDFKFNCNHMFRNINAVFRGRKDPTHLTDNRCRCLREVGGRYHGNAARRCAKEA